jgi:hypothetical protein
MEGLSDRLIHLNELVTENIRQKEFLQKIVDEAYDCNYPIFERPHMVIPVIVSKICHQHAAIRQFQDHINWYISNHI